MLRTLPTNKLNKFNKIFESYCNALLHLPKCSMTGFCYWLYHSVFIELKYVILYTCTVFLVLVYRQGWTQPCFLKVKNKFVLLTLFYSIIMNQILKHTLHLYCTCFVLTLRLTTSCCIKVSTLFSILLFYYVLNYGILSNCTVLVLVWPQGWPPPGV